MSTRKQGYWIRAFEDSEANVRQGALVVVTFNLCYTVYLKVIKNSSMLIEYSVLSTHRMILVRVLYIQRPLAEQTFEEFCTF